MKNHELSDVEHSVEYDSNRGLYVANFDWSEERSPSVLLIRAMASVAGCDTVALGPLHDSIDPDVLDRLLTSDASVTVEFTHASFDVTVSGDGRVTIQPEYRRLSNEHRYR